MVTKLGLHAHLAYDCFFFFGQDRSYIHIRLLEYKLPNVIAEAIYLPELTTVYGRLASHVRQLFILLCPNIPHRNDDPSWIPLKSYMNSGYNRRKPRSIGIVNLRRQFSVSDNFEKRCV